MQSTSISGVYVAAVTPHRKEGHRVDFAAALELVDYLGAAGVAGIALLGSTGEFPHLPLEDRIKLTHLVVRRSRVPVIAGISHSTLDGAIELARQAAESGAAALLLMPPYFFRYRQEEVHEFYLEFARAMQKSAPILLYNIPAFTTEIAIETAVDLLRTGLFAGIKDSSGRVEYFTRLQEVSAETPLSLLIGNDVAFTACRKAGAHGVVSGVACAVPELMLALDRAIQSGDQAATERLNARLHEFIGWIEQFPAPVGVKAATEARGLKIGPQAVPLSGPRQALLDQFVDWFRNWLGETKTAVAR